jgi:hypothetical protein
VIVERVHGVTGGGIKSWDLGVEKGKIAYCKVEKCVVLCMETPTFVPAETWSMPAWADLCPRGYRVDVGPIHMRDRGVSALILYSATERDVIPKFFGLYGTSAPSNVL